MARIQAIRQMSSFDKANNPMSSRMFAGNEGVPKMHPLKSSNPVLKATQLLHGIKSRIPRLPGMRMPRL